MESPEYQALPEGTKGAKGTQGLFPSQNWHLELVTFQLENYPSMDYFRCSRLFPSPKSAAWHETLLKAWMGCGWTQGAPKSRHCWFRAHSWDGKGQWLLPRADAVYKATLSVQVLLLLFFLYKQLWSSWKSGIAFQEEIWAEVLGI